jgi:Flp pilus assembly pilin Flp
MTEYVIFVALVAIAAIAVYELFGDTVRNQTAAIAQESLGTSCTGTRNSAQTAANAAATDAGPSTTCRTTRTTSGAEVPTVVAPVTDSI